MMSQVAWVLREGGYEFRVSFRGRFSIVPSGLLVGGGEGKLETSG